MPLLGIFLARMYTKRKALGIPISATNLARYLYEPDLAMYPSISPPIMDLRAIWFRSSIIIIDLRFSTTNQ